jgi:hypothetical protein
MQLVIVAVLKKPIGDRSQRFFFFPYFKQQQMSTTPIFP